MKGGSRSRSTGPEKYAVAYLRVSDSLDVTTLMHYYRSLWYIGMGKEQDWRIYNGV